MKPLCWNEDRLDQMIFQMSRAEDELGEEIRQLNRLRSELEALYTGSKSQQRIERDISHTLRRLRSAQDECNRLKKAMRRTQDIFRRAEQENARRFEDLHMNTISVSMNIQEKSKPASRTAQNVLPRYRGSNTRTAPLHSIVITENQLVVPAWLENLLK